MQFIRQLPRKALKAWPLVVVVVVSVVTVALAPVLTKSWRDIGIRHHVMVNELVYPTLGNPAIIKKGAALTLEFDPRNRAWDDEFVKCASFKVTAVTSRDPHPVELKLPVTEFEAGYSVTWPEYSKRHAHPNGKIYLVTVEVPGNTLEDLYDLKVFARLGNGDLMEDMQPHALQAVNEYKDRFSFCQLTDIHVFGPEAKSYETHERSARPDGQDRTRNGAVYYEKAITQINEVKPDFCIYTGDFIYGQSYLTQDQGDPWGWTSEYEYEQLWFYEETLKLGVPVFMIMGNHDSYNEGIEGAREDWQDNWQKLYGPLCFSFDYGDYHFLMANTQDWKDSMRTLEDTGISIQPPKSKGQVRGGGDPWAPGFTEARLAGIDENRLTGQLAWMRDDLRAHMASKMRICASHQDPWLPDGHGGMWASGGPGKGFLGDLNSALGLAGIFGNGRGRLAFIKLLQDYQVSLELTGHLHSDRVGFIPWKGGGGQVICANTTCTQFGATGFSESYPGYRRVWINKGQVESVNYKDPKWAYPFYAGTNVNGRTDLDDLTVPAIQSTLSPDTGNSEQVSWTTINTLARSLPDAFTKVSVPYLEGGYYYQVSNGRLGEFHDDREVAPNHRVYQVFTYVAPGETRTVVVTRSAEPDLEPPAGTASINGGAALVTDRDVTLSLQAVDTLSGVKDVMISNDPDFEGAAWVPYSRTLDWTLARGASGPRTVYIRFRDAAMPGNISPVVGASVAYAEPPS